MLEWILYFQTINTLIFLMWYIKIKKKIDGQNLKEENISNDIVTKIVCYIH